MTLAEPPMAGLDISPMVARFCVTSAARAEPGRGGSGLHQRARRQ